MRLKTTYNVLNEYLLRTTIFPLKHSINLINETNWNSSSIKEYLNNPLINKAIMLASHDYYLNMTSLIAGKVYSKKQRTKLENTFYKYLLRMGTRCTPFGLFSGCSVGSFKSSTNIELKKIKEHFIGIKNLENSQEFREETYLINTSIYLIDEFWRFFEKFHDDKEISYSLEQVKQNELLDYIINNSKRFFEKKEIFEILYNKGLNEQQASNYFNQLLDFQILLSNNGFELINGKTSFLKKPIDYKIPPINQTGGNNVDVDLFMETSKNQLNQNIKNQIIEAYKIISKIDIKSSEETRLEKFKKEFKKRYGDKEMELCHVLDHELGIDYLNSSSYIGNSSFISDLDIKPYIDERFFNLRLNKSHIILNKKAQEALKHGENEILLDSKDFENFNELHKMPNTLSSIIEIFDIKSTQHLYINSFVGRSAARLISRFGYGDPVSFP